MDHMTKKVSHLIGGKQVDGGDARTNNRPSDGSVFSEAPMGQQPEVTLAVKAARQSLPAWRDAPIAKRVECVRSLVALLRDAYGEEGEMTVLKRAVSEEVGKPLPEADLEVLECGDFIEYYCDVAEGTLVGKTLEINKELWPSKTSKLVYEPHGVVAIIKPWNYPIEMIAWTLGPAILAGNTVVIKPSEKSPVSAYEFAKLVQQSDIPSGVVNFLFGDRETGKMLASHPDVDMVSFTGSVPAGRNIAASAGKQIKAMCLELGGNDCALVDRDADLDLVSSGIVWGAFCNAGQVCVGIKKAYIHEEIYEELKSLVVEKTKRLREGEDYGPIVDEEQLGRFERFVEQSRNDGNDVLAGGKRGSSGYYFEPTIMEVTNEASVTLGEECFGPLLPLIKVESMRIAVEAANSSSYGLGASVWGRDLKRAEEIGRQLEVGMVWINDVNVAFPEAPWGGRKNSGIGFELSSEALLEYCVRKHISIETGDDKDRIWWYPY